MKYFQAHCTVMLVIVIALLGTVYSLIGLTSWKFSVVGDERAYWSFAQGIANKKLLMNPLSLHGVYGENQVIGNYYQAIFLYVFGPGLFVWKCSSVIALFPSVIVLYKFVRKLKGKNAAIIAAVLLAFSKYLNNFYKIGYAHSFCVFLLILSLYYANELLHAASKRNAVKLGLCLGISFFQYIGPLFSFFLLPFFIVLLKRRGKHALKPLILVGTTFLICMSIGLLSTPVAQWSGGLKRTALYPEFDSNIQYAINVGRNFLLFFKNFDYFYNHFVEGPYLDVISRWSAFIGILISLVGFRKKEGLLLSVWIFLCVGIGLTNLYRHTPATRGIFFIPYGAMFAGVGLEFLRKQFKKWGAAYFIPIAVIVAIGLNVYEAQIGVFKKTGFTRTALIMKELQEAKRDDTFILLYVTPEIRFDPQHVDYLMKAHRINPSRFTMTHVLDDMFHERYSKILVFKDDPLMQGKQENALQGRKIDNLPLVIVDGYSP